MDYLPVSLRLTDQPCLVVGGGSVALRKAALLSRAGARLKVVAPVIVEGIGEFSNAQVVTRAYEADDVRGARLVVAATDDANLNAQVAADATDRGVLVNVVDDPQRCTFVMPSIVDRSPMLVAISTAGAAPVLARMVRGDIEALLPPGLGPVSELLSRHRAAIKAALPELGARRRFMEALLSGMVVELAYAGDLAAAEAELRRLLDTQNVHALGEVAVVGTGPGDPDLLTFQAQRCMQQADHVLHRLDVSPAIVDRCRRDAARTQVPEGGGVSTLWDLARVHAQRGERVVVLVAGDGKAAATHMQREGASVTHVRHVPGLPA